MRWPRLERLANAVEKMGGGKCPTCRNGECLPPIQSWVIRTDGSEYLKKYPSDIYDESGHCRTCGRYSGGVTYRGVEWEKPA